MSISQIFIFSFKNFEWHVWCFFYNIKAKIIFKIILKIQKKQIQQNFLQ